MGRTTRHGPGSRGVSLAQRVLWALVAVVLVVAPAFDVTTSAHFRPGYGSGARCPLHANPGLTAEAGVEQRLIQELLGHSGIRISERYTRPRRPALRRAALKATRLMGVEPLPSA